MSLVAGRTDVALPDIPIADARTLQIELTAQLPTKISTSDTSTVLLNPMSHSILTGMPLEGAFAQITSIQVDDASEASGLTIGLLISYRRGDRQFLCYAPPENGTVLIDRAIDGCEQANQMPYPNEPRVLERFDIDMHSDVGGFLLNSTIDHIALLAPGSVSHRPLSVAVANSSTIMERSGAVTVKEQSAADADLAGHAVRAVIDGRVVNGIVEESSPTTLTLQLSHATATYLISDVSYISRVTPSDSALKFQLPPSTAQCYGFLVENAVPLRLDVAGEHGRAVNLALGPGRHDLCVPNFWQELPVVATLVVPAYSLPGPVSNLAFSQASVDDSVSIYRDRRIAAVLTPSRPELSSLPPGIISAAGRPLSVLRTGRSIAANKGVLRAGARGVWVHTMVQDFDVVDAHFSMDNFSTADGSACKSLRT